MKHTDLTFNARLKIIDLLSKQEGPLGKTEPYKRVLDKIRLTDEEFQQLVITPVGDTHVNYTPPTPEFGRMTVEVENADASAVVALLEAWPHFTTADHQWAQHILKDFKA